MKALIPLIVSLVVLAVPLAAQQFTPDKAALQSPAVGAQLQVLLSAVRDGRLGPRPATIADWYRRRLRHSDRRCRLQHRKCKDHW